MTTLTWISVVGLAVGLVVCGTNTAAGQVPLNPTDGVYTEGDWTYQLVVLKRGTAAATGVGKLSFKGKEVVGSPFARLRNELGEFMWAGYECGTPRLGWYRIDPRKKYARWTMVRIDEAQQGPFWTVTKQ